jgi:hypothetical protein
MAVVTLEGVIENGQIRLPAHLHLRDKTKVYILIPDFEAKQVARIPSPRLLHPEQADDFKKEVVEVKPNAGL